MRLEGIAERFPNRLRSDPTLLAGVEASRHGPTLFERSARARCRHGRAWRAVVSTGGGALRCWDQHGDQEGAASAPDGQCQPKQDRRLPAEEADRVMAAVAARTLPGR